jgi:hypothetical protein
MCCGWVWWYPWWRAYQSCKVVPKIVPASHTPSFSAILFLCTDMWPSAPASGFLSCSLVAGVFPCQPLACPFQSNTALMKIIYVYALWDIMFQPDTGQYVLRFYLAPGESRNQVPTAKWLLVMNPHWNIVGDICIWFNLSFVCCIQSQHGPWSNVLEGWKKCCVTLCHVLLEVLIMGHYIHCCHSFSWNLLTPQYPDLSGMETTAYMGIIFVNYHSILVLIF